LHKVADDKDLADKTVEQPSKESQDCGKIKFEPHNNLILSMQEQILINLKDDFVLLLFVVSQKGGATH